jgi:homoserine dehydrogenase
VSQEEVPTVIVLKFGSSVLRSVRDLPTVVHEIYRWYRDGHRVIAVVSAIGNTTEGLIQESQALTGNPEHFALAELLATGERTCAALLGVALDRAGVPSRVVNPHEIGFSVAGTALDAEPSGIDFRRVQELQRTVPVLVVPGFFGSNTEGRTQLLGRGGSDLTAVFLAVALHARCRLLKDVDGVYESDPADERAHPRRFAQLSYEDALKVTGKLIQPKALTYLEQHRSQCEVAGLALPYATIIHKGPTTTTRAAGPQAPLDVLLLGCGTVGFGVYKRLRALPKYFRVIGVLVQDLAKHETAGVDSHHLYTNCETIRKLRPALVIDALPRPGVSVELLTHFLRRGVHGVSANKAVVAEYGGGLTSIASDSSAVLRYCAAVGGSAPMLETVAAACVQAPIIEIAAVLNGTCNFVLDACATGALLSEAIGEAQRLGFAENDPSEDLSGRDAARKLQILVRHAFGTNLSAVSIQVLNDSIVQAARGGATTGRHLRQIARAQRRDGRVAVTVGFEPTDPESPFYTVSGEWNALALTLVNGEVISVRGRGAGRWPTTEAVMADVFAILRASHEHQVDCAD